MCKAEDHPAGTHVRLLATTASTDLLLDELGAPLLIVQIMLLLPRLFLLAADGLWVTVNVLDVPAFRGLIDLTQTWQ